MDLITFAGAALDTTSAIEPRAFAVLAAGLAIGLGSLGASLAIGIAASRAFDAGARQPEVSGCHRASHEDRGGSVLPP